MSVDRYQILARARGKRRRFLLRLYGMTAAEMQEHQKKKRREWWRKYKERPGVRERMRLIGRRWSKRPDVKKKILIKAKKYLKKNYDKILAYNRRYRREHPKFRERRNRDCREWRKKNKRIGSC